MVEAAIYILGGMIIALAFRGALLAVLRFLRATWGAILAVIGFMVIGRFANLFPVEWMPALWVIALMFFIIALPLISFGYSMAADDRYEEQVRRAEAERERTRRRGMAG